MNQTSISRRRLNSRSKQSQRLHDARRQQAVVRHLETLEDRQMLTASVWTDKADYAPGETAMISGSGFLVGETISLLVKNSNSVPNTGEVHSPWLVTDGGEGDADGTADGNFLTSWYVNPDDSGGSMFELSAAGLASGKSASHVFTHGNPKHLEPTTPTAGISVSKSIFYQGHTLGFWKTNAEFHDAVAWPSQAGVNASVPLTPDDPLSKIFSSSLLTANGLDPNTTLLTALNTGGGDLNNLMRQGVSAALNASHSSIFYPLNYQQVVNLVNGALDGSLNVNTVASTLDGYNNLGSGLDQHGLVSGDDGYDDVDNSGSVTIGDKLTYKITITNTGGVPLSNISVIDSLAGPLSLPEDLILENYGDSYTLYVTLTVTAAMLTPNGNLTNVACASADVASGDEDDASDDFTDCDSVTIPVIAPMGKIIVEKETNPDGDLREFEFDPSWSGTNFKLTDGQSWTSDYLLAGNYSVSELLPAGWHLSNIEIVSGDADGGSTLDLSTCTANIDLDAGETIRIRFKNKKLMPSIDLDKYYIGLANDADHSGTVTLGDTLQYGFLVTNTGELPLTNIVVTDSRPGIGPMVGGATTLAPGAHTVFTATYVVTQADIDFGCVVNSASVKATPSVGAGVSDRDEDFLPLLQTASVVLDKTAALTHDVGMLGISAGDTLTYSFKVTNTGNTTLNPITVIDPLPGLSAITLPFTILAPGQSVIGTATYVVTLADAQKGFIQNQATAFGNPPFANPNSTSDDVSASDTLMVTVRKDVQNGQGCTPGFWKNNADKHGAASWPVGYSPQQPLSTLFQNSEGLNLLQALNMGGGGVNALLRHAVAGVLNAAHPNINYPLTTQEIVTAVNAARASGNAAIIENLKDMLAGYNEAGCNIDQHGDPDNPLPVIYGDANLDGKFDSADLVLVFQLGQYEDGVPHNSYWGSGDWNGDGDFTTADLVLAFQQGLYEAGPVSALPSSHVAAAVDQLYSDDEWFVV